MAEKTKVAAKTQGARGSARTTPVKSVAANRRVGKATEKEPMASKPSSKKPAATKAPSAGAVSAKTSTTSERKLSNKTAVNSKAAAAEKTTPKSKASTTTPAKATTTARATHRAGSKTPSAPQQRATTAAMAKPAQPKISAPVASKDVAAKARAAKAESQSEKKPVNSRHGFKTNEYVVYPTHGVGRIVGIEEQEIAGMSLELFVITFEKDKMTLRVPTSKLQSVGMRKLATEDVVKKAMDTLKGRARIKRTMWSRRAQEYEAKINSGDLVAIAEVVRDLYRSETQPEQSYSERQLYEAALDRMAREIAAVEKLDEQTAVQRITEVLAKSARGRRQAEADAEAEAEGDGEEADPAVKAA